MKQRPRRIAICHPDLGIGGAERFVVDAAYELATAHGCSVEIFTCHYDPDRCFHETKDRRLEVVTAGGWFPRTVFGRGQAACAYVRVILCALYLIMTAWLRPFDAILVDQVAVVVPLLRLCTSARVMFYCHFPDLLLSRPAGVLKRLYRAPLDWAEERATGCAPVLAVNSEFTLKVFRASFPSLRHLTPQVLHPCVRLPDDAELAALEGAAASEVGLREVQAWLCGRPMFLSVNRFERKKNLELALQALSALLESQPGSNACVVVAGGYDTRLEENVQYYQELVDLVGSCGLPSSAVLFLRSVSDAQRAWLLHACRAVLYTPSREHFGIVPLESMAAGRAVVAVCNGGPLESIRDGETGFLLPSDASLWACAMQQLLEPGTAARMGAAARAHVQSNFSRHKLGIALKKLLTDS